MRTLSVQSKWEDVSVHAESPSSPASMNHQVVQQSPWHSPVPYLFGGLAVMFGLVAFALLILACSYWRLSSSDGQDGGGVDEEKESRFGDKMVNREFEDKFLVIMAGDDLPRFLATPAMKKCTCGVHEAKIVISKENSVAEEEEEEKMRESGEEKVRDTGEP